MKEILELKNIYFSFDKKEVLRDINLKLYQGDFLGIIGPNGGGKTTLIKVLLGILKKDKGSVKLFGKNLRYFKDWNKIGYVPQKVTQFDFNFPSTVEEIVELGLLSRKKIPRIITKEDKKKIKQILNELKLKHLEKNKIGELSGGQQQRVFIAKALISEPELLILDEPTVGIDNQSQKEFYELLHKINKNNITIIMITHDLSYVTRYISKVACINKNLIFHGTHEEFCDSHLLNDVLGKDKHIICHEHTKIIEQNQNNIIK